MVTRVIGTLLARINFMLYLSSFIGYSCVLKVEFGDAIGWGS